MKIRLLITLLHIECGASSERPLDKNRIFSEIDEESIGGPSPDALDLVQWSPSKSKCGRTTRTKRVASDFIGQKYFANPVNEPGMSRDITIGMEPELGKMRKKVVARGKVNFKEMHQVNARCVLFKDDSGPFKEAIGFVHGEEQ